jgi:hypothetical protein
VGSFLPRGRNWEVKIAAFTKILAKTREACIYAVFTRITQLMPRMMPEDDARSGGIPVAVHPAQSA